MYRNHDYHLLYKNGSCVLIILATREGKMAYVARVGLPVLILRKKDSSGRKQLN